MATTTGEDERLVKAVALSRLLDDFLKANAVEIFMVSGTRSETGRQLPVALLEHKKKHGKWAGFTFVVTVHDRSKKKCYIAACQDGTFWPIVPGPEEGKGALARNQWASVEFAKRFEAYRGQPTG